MIAFVSVGGAYAQTTEATVSSSLSKYTVVPGEQITVTVTVQNTVSTQFQIIRIGMHGDWMGKDSNGYDNFLGPNLQGNPPTLDSTPYIASFIITVPTDISQGSHTYYIGVDAQDSSGYYYSWNSPESAIQVTQGSVTGNPTQTTAPTDDGTGGTTDYMFYIAIVAIVILVILVLLVLLTLRRRNRSKPATQYPTTPSQPESAPENEPEPQQQPAPEDKPASDENFDI